MSRVIAVINQKGGVGKTTTAISLAAYLARTGRVLLVDVDPQANATSALGMARHGQPAMYEVLVDGLALEEIVESTREPGLDLAPSSPALAGAQIELVPVEDRDERLRN